MVNYYFKDELYHHGVKGMKWGIRKNKYKRVITGKNIKLGESKYIKGSYKIINKKNNKKIGDLIVDNKGNTNHIDWIGIKEKDRRKGYGSETIDIIIKDSRKKGKKYITLDAAGLDPAAVHIYSKKGFKPIKKVSNDLWNDLIIMRKKL